MITPGRCDLHVHSSHSDGILSPAEVVRAAEEAGLCAVSVTDHDTAAGQEEALEAGTERSVEVVTGIEMSVSESGLDIHILGYMFDHRHGALVSVLEVLEASRHDRAEKMTGLLRGEGVDIDFDEVEKEGGAGTLGRPHIARLLMRKKVVTRFQEAFERFIGYGACCYVPKKVLPLEQVVEVITRAGGVPVWAHPGPAIYDGALLDRMVSAGIRGIEAYHPNHKDAIARKIVATAAGKDLAVTGGSDYHFPEAMKVPIGGVDVPCSAVDTLRERAGRLST